MHPSALASVMKVAAVTLMILQAGVQAAPTERGFVKAPHPLPGLSRASAAPDKVSSPSQYLKRWFLSTKAAGADAATRATAGMGRQRADTWTAGPDKRSQMLKMISALEELHRTFNSTLSSRITIIPRASSRNSGRKNKPAPAADAGVKATTAAPAAADSTSRASGEDVPGLTGRSFKKSLPPQTKKTNKRVCFWKYCSQN